MPLKAIDLTIWLPFFWIKNQINRHTNKPPTDVASITNTKVPMVGVLRINPLFVDLVSSESNKKPEMFDP
jgi:hypothetical protein